MQNLSQVSFHEVFFQQCSSKCLKGKYVPDGQRSNSKSNFILGWLPYQIRRTFKISSAKSCQGWCWEWWDERREKFGKQKASFQFYPLLKRFR